MAARDFSPRLKNIHPVAIATFDLAVDQCEKNPRVSERTAAITGNSHLCNFNGFGRFRGCSGHISILIGCLQFIDREGCAMIPNVPRSAINLAYKTTARITGIYRA